MGDSLAEVGVVVVTHNSAADVLRALTALPLDRLSGVVVVDNASRDGTPDLVERARLPGVTVVQASNEGFGAGCNRGLEALPPSRWVLLLNPDAVVQEPDLSMLVTYLERHPTAAVVAPRLFRGEEPLTSAGAVATARSELRFALPPRIGRLLPDRRHPPGFDRSGPVGVVEGACMLVDVAALRDVGGFDEGYFLFYEEHELSRRLALRGRGVHLCAEARAQHAVGVSRETLPWEGRDHYWRSSVRYLRRWSPPAGALVVATAVRVWLTWAVVRRSLPWSEARRLAAVLSRGPGSTRVPR